MYFTQQLLTIDFVDNHQKAEKISNEILEFSLLLTYIIYSA